jgi:hypothetical protein
MPDTELIDEVLHIDEAADPFAPRMPFGRYRGRPIRELPSDYLAWLVTLELRAPLAEAVREELGRRAPMPPRASVRPPRRPRRQSASGWRSENVVIARRVLADPAEQPAVMIEWAKRVLRGEEC